MLYYIMNEEEDQFFVTDGTLYAPVSLTCVREEQRTDSEVQGLWPVLHKTSEDSIRVICDLDNYVPCDSAGNKLDTTTTD